MAYRFEIPSLSFLVACSQPKSSTKIANSDAGILLLKVNPEIAIFYDEEGKVTNIESRNDDAKKIIESYTDFKGKDAKKVVTDLVAVMGKAGYLVEEIEGSPRKIVIEIEKGSRIDDKAFLDDIVLDVKKYVNENQFKASFDIEGESDYGIEQYVDTDYGIDNDGITDYNKNKVNNKKVQDDDSDYGPNNDGITDYNKTSNNKKVQNNDSDYGPNNDGVTDYSKKTNSNSSNNTSNNSSNSSSNNSNYGNSNYGNSNYDDGDND